MTAPARITYREATKQGLREALLADPRVFLMGEDVGRYGGCFAVSKGLLDEFGEERIRDTPLSESAFVGAGIGAALGGLRPVVEVMTVNFSLLALDQIVNTAATLCHMSGGQFPVPVVIRMATGAGRQLAAQHSHSFEAWYAHVPGLRVVEPATIDDARGIMRAALASPDPVIVFEPISLYNMEGELTDAATQVQLEGARVHRAGDGVTLVTYGASLWRCVAAAESLAQEGIDAEIVDLRCLRPIDDATVLASVRKTRRVVIVDEGWRTCSLAAEVGQRIVEQGFYDLDAPIARVCTEEVPIPYPQASRARRVARPRTHRCRSAEAASAMLTEFRLPALGADMDAGTIVEWHVAPGDRCRRGDVVAVVETDKGAIDVEIFVDGVVRELRVPPGTRVPVGTVLAVLDTEAPAPASETLPAPPPIPAVEGAGAVVPQRVKISPAARKRAQELHVDVASLRGTGPDGALTVQDVERAGSVTPAPAFRRGGGCSGHACGDRRSDVALQARDSALLPCDDRRRDARRRLARGPQCRGAGDRATAAAGAAGQGGRAGLSRAGRLQRLLSR